MSSRDPASASTSASAFASGGPERDAVPPPGDARNVRSPGEPQRDTVQAPATRRNVKAPDAAAARIATRQKGAIAHSQLLEAGIGAGAIKGRARRGLLHRFHRGVYIAGHLALAEYAHEKAALLAAGDGALLSHWTAAHVLGLTPDRPPTVHVTLINRRARPKHGVRIHTVSTLDHYDITARDGLRLTNTARTLIDLAATATSDQLERLVSEARAKRVLSDTDLQRALTRAARRAGVGAMRAFIAREDTPGFTRSEAERRMRRLTKTAGLPQPVTNTRIGRYEADFLWPEHRLVVEVDGYGVHGHRTAFERDRRKTLALTAAGYRVIRITWRQLVHEPLFVAAQLAQALAVGPGDPPGRAT